MKKLITCLGVLFVAVCFAVASEEIDDKSMGTGTYRLERASARSGDVTLTVNSIVVDDIAVDSVLVDGRSAVVTTNASQLMLAASLVTMHAGTVYTGTFSTVFSTNPVMTVSYTEDPGDVRPLYVTTLTASNFTVTATADKNFNWIAVGSK